MSKAITLPSMRLAASKKIAEATADRVNAAAEKIAGALTAQITTDDTFNAEDAQVKLPKELFGSMLPDGVTAEQVAAVRTFDDEVAAAMALATAQVATHREAGPLSRLRASAEFAGAQVEAQYTHKYTAPSGGQSGAGDRTDHFGRVRVGQTTSMAVANAACKTVHEIVSDAFKSSVAGATTDAAAALS